MEAPFFLRLVWRQKYKEKRTADTQRKSYVRRKCLASNGADSSIQFYRYNSVYCPLQVFLSGKLDEKASVGVAPGGAAISLSAG
ncbi:MAG: hypothetical protein ACTTIT_00640 [Treponema sp.]